ncbi:endonuclease/exonuclease/phosphatase family protein [Shewanella alkalitolerans]|uniref:endonuclease/exonuclease/phosphatase family protein n=1 Tax=Shewanella alkalitolerans TaxID=2864209 RepID=UPI001C65766F|nr:endonuclease/exonuclease/phosphatase family protein [Shewanella alkalitolerans]QYJ99475.1 endonuclease/exonuclease/phosphatase family protein [Shewanella alkalitolerans]
MSQNRSNSPRLLRWGIKSLLLLLLSVAAYVAVVTYLNGEPEVMMSEVEPVFVSQCVAVHTSQALDNDGQLRVGVWNIYKQQKRGWQQDLSKIAERSELMLLQEAKLNAGFNQYLNGSSLHLVMAKAFSLLKSPVGVMNLATEQARDACAYHAVEPWIRFAKSTLISRYPLSNGQTLLVVNLHGINFDWQLKSYRAQWQQIVQKINLHQGPVILGGDFNTWRGQRMAYIEQLAHQLRLKEAVYEEDKRQRVFGLPLDHLYYRGLNLVAAESFTSQASDHNPIWAEFRLKPVTH